MVSQFDIFMKQLEFAPRLGMQLKNFSQTGPRSWKFSHSCEDTKGGKTKARANFFEHKSTLMMHCYHCGISSSFKWFLRQENPALFKEYSLETFRIAKGDNLDESNMNTQAKFNNSPELILDVPVPKKKNLLDGLIFLNSLEKSHPIVKYATDRKIPESFFDRIAYVADFGSYYNKNREDNKNELKTSGTIPRLVLPYFDKVGNVPMVTCRAFGDEQPKYMYLFDGSEKTASTGIYGLWRIDHKERILVTEGQIDSLLLENAIAVGGTNYSKNEWLLENKFRVIIVPDSDWRTNKHVQKSLLAAVDAGFGVSFLPDVKGAKDVNDLIKRGWYRKELTDYLKANFIYGLKAIGQIKLLGDKKLASV